MSAKMSGELLICGLGPRPPHDTTLEALRALESCDVVYSEAELELLPSKKLPAASAVVAAAKTKKVGVGLIGHPVSAVTELGRLADKAGVKVTLVPGMTALGKSLAVEKRGLSWRRR